MGGVDEESFRSFDPYRVKVGVNKPLHSSPHSTQYLTMTHSLHPDKSTSPSHSIESLKNT